MHRFKFAGLATAAALIAATNSPAFGHGSHVQQNQPPHAPVVTKTSPTTATVSLPPLPSGVSALDFGQFFKAPIGPFGLEFTPKMRALDGKKVRILGYMVAQEEPALGVFILAPRPVQLHEHEYGLADDLPPTTLHVEVPVEEDQIVPHTPGPLLLTGTLKIGNRQEADGRISFAHLRLDKPTSQSLSVR